MVIAIAASFLAGALAALLFSFLTITLRANQNVTGLALTIFGTGVGQYIGEFMRVREGTYVAVSNTLKGAFNGSPFPAFLQELPVVGRLLFSHSIFTYLGIALAVAMGLYLHHSRSGLYLRAVGESPPPPMPPASASPAASIWPPSSAAASRPSAAWCIS